MMLGLAVVAVQSQSFQHASTSLKHCIKAAVFIWRHVCKCVVALMFGGIDCKHRGIGMHSRTWHFDGAPPVIGGTYATRPLEVSWLHRVSRHVADEALLREWVHVKRRVLPVTPDCKLLRCLGRPVIADGVAARARQAAVSF
jgi:hypothetical protein